MVKIWTHIFSLRLNNQKKKRIFVTLFISSCWLDVVRKNINDKNVFFVFRHDGLINLIQNKHTSVQMKTGFCLCSTRTWNPNSWDLWPSLWPLRGFQVQMTRFTAGSPVQSQTETRDGTFGPFYYNRETVKMSTDVWPGSDQVLPSETEINLQLRFLSGSDKLDQMKFREGSGPWFWSTLGGSEFMQNLPD